MTNTPSTSNIYLAAGTYNSRLTVFDNDGDNDTTTRTVTVSNRPDVTIDKSHTGNFRTGTQGSYTLSVSNAGGATGPTVGTTTVTDTLPAGLTYVSATGTGWTCGAVGQLVTCNRTAAIAAGATAPAITLNVNVGDAARPSVTNTAEVTTPVESVTNNNSDSDPTTVDAVDVAITKSHTGSFRVGRNEPYTLQVRNDGTLPTTGTTTVNDTLPIGMTYFSSSAPAGWSCNGSGSSFSCTNPNPLPVGYDEDITLTVAVDGTAVPLKVNTATISTPGDTDPSDNSSSDSTVVVAAPDLAIDKSHDGNFRVGGSGTYELQVKNDGALPSAGTTTVTDSVPAGLPITAVTAPGWTCNVTGQDVSCEITSVLQPDELAPLITIDVDVTQAALPSVINTATVANTGVGPAADPNPANDSDSDPTTITAVDLADRQVAHGHVPGRRQRRVHPRGEQPRHRGDRRSDDRDRHAARRPHLRQRERLRLDLRRGRPGRDLHPQRRHQRRRLGAEHHAERHRRQHDGDRRDQHGRGLDDRRRQPGQRQRLRHGAAHRRRSRGRQVPLR